MNNPPEPRQAQPSRYILSLSCPDRPGIVYAVSKFLVEQDCTIIESHQFDDPDAHTFFMRITFTRTDGNQLDAQRIAAAFLEEVARPLSMTWRLNNADEKTRVLIMVSKFGHCLNDLLFRAASGALNIEIAAIVSNHPDMARMADSYRIPFHHIPITPETKPEGERKLLDLVDELDVDLVVLARYMQILSGDLCKALEGRAINIHHSMLPSFKGARPYNQAHLRGVKFIGATAHYVTPDLDEGPIIEQAVARVNHSMSAADVTKLGRDTECLALARAVAWHTENRVMLDGHRTVVFS